MPMSAYAEDDELQARAPGTEPGMEWVRAGVGECLWDD